MSPLLITLNTVDLLEKLKISQLASNFSVFLEDEYVHYPTHKISPIDPILNQTNP
jgi:hypothetical protein